jgi:anti-sigma factor RsiW
MNCEEYQQQVSKLLDSALEKTKSPELFSHLGVCEECREFFTATMRIRAAMLSAPPLSIPAQMETGHRLLESEQSRTVNSVPPAAFASTPGSLQARLSRFRAAVVVGLLVLISGLCWTEAVRNQPTERDESVQQLGQPEMPNHQP